MRGNLMNKRAKSAWKWDGNKRYQESESYLLEIWELDKGGEEQNTMFVLWD